MRKVLIFFFLLGFCLIGTSAFSQTDSERAARLVVKGKYFDIYMDKRADIYSVLQKIDYRKVTLGALSSSNKGDVKHLLSDTLDSIFLDVSDILDAHIYTFKANLKIVFTQDDISNIYEFYFKKPFMERSFYIYEKNTVYISYSDLTLGMLGHEIAHAVISYYFGVPPPPKIQEVLAGYVEYHLRKKTGTLE